MWLRCKEKKKDLTNLASSEYDRIKRNKGAFQVFLRTDPESRSVSSGAAERRSRCVRRSSGGGHVCPADM